MKSTPQSPFKIYYNLFNPDFGWEEFHNSTQDSRVIYVTKLDIAVNAYKLYKWFPDNVKSSINEPDLELAKEGKLERRSKYQVMVTFMVNISLKKITWDMSSSNLEFQISWVLWSQLLSGTVGSFLQVGYFWQLKFISCKCQ
ncbi:hypothetical protein E2C01_054832 [Portunus trituberculatus]|uniref:Uncharacterized protein n=1 Tax=Portunus trituberculatus TaxID=210409 RepID=A0A5B7GT90_PORTR|nr:hypothetical protein [Portunus trituberculatus]